MEYIVSMAGPLDSARGIQRFLWYNLWRIRLQPYRELVEGDVLYWYEPPEQQVSWRSRVSWVDRFKYSRKDQVKGRLGLKGDGLRDPYYVRAPGGGYCLAWRVSDVRRVRHAKPQGASFPQQGWLRVTENVARRWLSKAPSDDVTLDDLTSSNASIWRRLAALNEEMKDVSPDRVRRIVSQTIRRDTALIRTLKRLCGHRCQFPRCGIGIKRRKGGLYVEVAHIEPVHKGGRSVLGNLVVLCPNHHKEFDHGARRIVQQTAELVEGTLNGKAFAIRLPRMAAR